MKSTSIYSRKPCLRIFSEKNHSILTDRMGYKIYNYDSKFK